ncbi:MAG: GntR family transcriptional regulator [Erysipelotrichaceae bacterium]
MIALNNQTGKPIYEQIVDQIMHYIALGIYQQDEPLPSVRNMATMLSINPNTVQKAYQELEHRGTIYAITKKGYFVSNPEASKAQLNLATVNDLKGALQRCSDLAIPKATIEQLVKDYQPKGE